MTADLFARYLSESPEVDYEDSDLDAAHRLIRRWEPLFDFVARLAADGQTTLLERLYWGNTRLHMVVGDVTGFRRDSGFAARAGSPFRDGDRASVHALRALAGLALALTGGVPAEGPLRSALAWYTDARGSLAGPTWDPYAVDWGQPRLAPIMALLADVAGNENSAGAALTTALTLYALATRPRPTPTAKARRARQASVKVLLVRSSDEGIQARLHVSVAQGLPPGFAPDPSQMTLFSADPKFQQSLGTAWSLGGAPQVGGTVLWSIKETEGPSPRIEGRSAEAALAATVDEIRRLSRPLAGLLVVRRLQDRNAIVGRIDHDGSLQGVEGYEAKLAALDEHSRVIVPAADKDEATEAAAGRSLEIVPAIRWTDAASKARRRNGKVLLFQVIAATLVLLFTTVGALWKVSEDAAQQRINALRDAARAAALKAAGELAVKSGDLGDSDPVNARLDAVAAFRLDPSSPQVGYAMQRAAVLPGLAVLDNKSPGTVHALAFSPDGKLLAVGTGTQTLETLPTDSGGLQLWNVSSHTASGPPLAIRNAGTVLSAAFSPSGKLLATGTASGGTELWDVSRHQLIATLPAGRGYEVTSLAFSRDGRTLAAGVQFNTSVTRPPAGGDVAGPEGYTQLWDVDRHRQISVPLAGDGDGVQGVAISPDGTTLAVATTSSGVTLWNLATRQQVGSPLFPGEGCGSPTFSPDGKNLAFSTPEGVEIIDVKTRRQAAAVAPAGYGAAYGSIAFSPVGTPPMLAVSRDGVVQLWDVRSGKQVGITISGTGGGSIDTLAFSPDGTTLATGTGVGTDLWNMTAVAGRPTATLHAQAEVTELTFARDGTTLAVSTETRASLWDSRSGQSLGSPISLSATGISLGVRAALSPDGTWLAVVDTTRGQLRDLRTHEQVSLPGSTGGATALAFASDSRLLAVGTPLGTQIWNVTAGRRTRTLPWDDPVDSIAFSPAGKLVLTGGTNQAQLWNVTDGKPVGAAIASGSAFSVAFSPDGKTAALATAAGVQLIDVATRQRIGSALATGIARSVAWSPDGTVLAVATDTGTQLWNVAIGQRIGPTLGAGEVVAVAWDPNGRTVAAGSFGTVQLWDVSDLVAVDAPSLLCAQAGQTLPRVQWASLAPGVPYHDVCPSPPTR